MPGRSSAPSSLSVVLEIGKRKVFASALDWPGLCRSGRNEAESLDALAQYRARYVVVAEGAGLRLPEFGPDALVVAEHQAGSATTDFGAPGAIAELERRARPAASARRQAALVRSAWAVLDRVAAGAPAQLRKGPRGGGRDRDAIVAHVLDAESAYARKLGLHLRPGRADEPAETSERRDQILAVLRRAWSPAVGDGGWPPAYAARRIAWHVLDHAWEIEDRSSAAP